MNQDDNTLGQRRLRILWAFAAAAPLVTGCGGGGSSDAGAAAPATSPVTAPSPPSPAPTPAMAELSTCGLANFSARILQRINQLRASGASCGSSGQFASTSAVAWNAKLTQAADGHSQDMAASNYFAHTSQDGRTFAQRIDATGYTWSSAGENIAAGYATVDAVMDGWIQSAGHCANLMNPNFSEIGVACVPGTSSDAYSNYWTMDLAKPR
jgi:uncharacterized protein YkwD